MGDLHHPLNIYAITYVYAIFYDNVRTYLNIIQFLENDLIKDKVLGVHDSENVTIQYRFLGSRFDSKSIFDNKKKHPYKVAKHEHNFNNITRLSVIDRLKSRY